MEQSSIKLGGATMMKNPEIIITKQFIETRLSDQFLAQSYEVIVPIKKTTTKTEKVNRENLKQLKIS